MSSRRAQTGRCSGKASSGIVMAGSNMGRRFSMNGRSLAGIGLFCMLWAYAAGPAASAPLCVHALCLPEDAAWRRGSTEQETADDAFILERAAEPENPLQVVVLRTAPVVRGDADAYYDRVTRFWHANYGKAVLVYWQEADGARWRGLRRPAQEQGMGVFQLVTVHDGRAYSLLVFVPGTATTLPAPARQLLDGIRFAAGEPKPTQASQAPRTSTQAPPERWLRTHAYRAQVAAEELEQRTVAEVRHLGDGMLTGHGLRYGESGVEWFMDGYVWRDASENSARSAWEVRGTLRVEAPAEWSDTAPWSLSLSLPEGQEPVSARLNTRVFCGRRDALRAALERLGRGDTTAVQGLASDCATAAVPLSPPVLRGEPGKTTSATWQLPAPTLKAGAGQGEEASVGLVEALLETEPGRRLPGEALIGGVRLVFAYEPAAPQ